MIVKDEFLNKLRRFFSLNLYEVKIWTALLSRGVSTAGELSDIANVPRSRSYDVLESLEKKGFVVMKVGKPIKYIAIPPSEVIERVKKKIKQEAEEKEKILDEIKKERIIEELNNIYYNNFLKLDPSEVTSILRGRENIYFFLGSLIKNAKKSIIIKTSSDGLERKMRSIKNKLKKAKKRGVKIKIVAPLKKENKEIAEDIKKFFDIKHSDEEVRFVVVDGKDILFMLNSDKELHPDNDAAVYINSEHIGSFLHSIIENI